MMYLATTAPLILALWSPSAAVSNPAHVLVADAPARPAAVSTWYNEQLKQITSLEKDWDGYDADPIGSSVIQIMAAELADSRLQVFGKGHVVPGADGSLQTEWDHTDQSFALLIEPDGTFTFWVKPEGGDEVAKSGLAGRDLMAALALNQPQG